MGHETLLKILPLIACIGFFLNSGAYAAPSTFATPSPENQAGIGAYIDSKNGFVVIVAPLPGSPAEQAGLKAKDRILAIDGKDMTGVTRENALSLIRGSLGSKVQLHIQRDKKEFDVTMIRASVQLPEVTVGHRQNVAIVKLIQMGNTTLKEFRRVMQELHDAGDHIFILDLRNNPGGYLEAIEAMVSTFVPKGTAIFQLRTTTGTQLTVTQDEPIFTEKNVKILILVNGGTAEAAEVVAAVLRDQQGATLIGEPTYGGADVNARHSATGGQVTDVQYGELLLSNGKSFGGIGLRPTIAIHNSSLFDRQMQYALRAAKRR